jgi:hypothetical protein
MAKRTWCLWLLVITVLLMVVGLGMVQRSTWALEDRIRSLELEALYVHKCVFVYDTLETGACFFPNSYEDKISPFRDTDIMKKHQNSPGSYYWKEKDDE